MKRCWILLFLILFGHPGRSSTPAPATNDSETQDRLRDSYRRLISKCRGELQSADARPWDVAARAEAIGSDPRALLEFVRTKIRFEPYPGLQRGPSGTLVSRGGNSADKAHLLAELLRSRGHRVRIVRATLEAKRAEELAAAALAAAQEGPAVKTSGPFGAGTRDEKRLADLCAETGLSPDEFSREHKADALRRDDLWNEILDVTDREVAFLLGRFGDSKGRELHADIVEWLRTHYWVQWQAPGSDDWTDLDPTFPGLDLKGEVVNPAAVADLFRIQLFLDRDVDARRETVLLMEFEVPVYEALLRPVRFGILPDRGWEELLQTKEQLTEAQVRERLLSFRRFQAGLQIGSEAVGSKPFDLDGKVFKVSANGSFTGATAAEKLQGATDLFDDTPKPKVELKSVSVRFGIVREGKDVWTRDRAILAEGKRDGWCPILSWNLFFQTHALSGAFERGMKMKQAVSHQGFVERSMEAADPGAPPGAYPFRLLSFARARQSFVYARAGGLLWEHADLFLTGSQVSLKGKAALCLCEGFDLVENGALVVEAGKRFTLRRDETCALGTFDTVLEQVLLRGANPSEGTLGTLAPFERARIFGEEILDLDATDAGRLVDAGLSKPDADWVVRHAPPGERVLVVRGRGSAWWSHDPATGRTVGRTTGGRGGCEVRITSVEYMSLGQNVFTAAVCMGVVLIKLHRGRNVSELDRAMFMFCIAGSLTGLGTVAFASSEFAASVSFGVMAMNGLLTLINEMVTD